jgi:hypothetical protein
LKPWNPALKKALKKVLKRAWSQKNLRGKAYSMTHHGAAPAVHFT